MNPDYSLTDWVSKRETLKPRKQRTGWWSANGGVVIGHAGEYTGPDQLDWL